MTTYQITFNERNKAGKYLLALLEENKKCFKVNEPTKMTEKEFDAKLQRAREQYARGECKELKPEDQRKFLGLE